MTARQILRLFAHSTLVAIRDSINDFHAALVPSLEIVIDDIMDRASEEAERERGRDAGEQAVELIDAMRALEDQLAAAKRREADDLASFHALQGTIADLQEELEEARETIRALSGALQDHVNPHARDLLALDRAHAFFDRSAPSEPETVPDVSVTKRASVPPAPFEVDEPAIGDGEIHAEGGH